MKQGGEGSLERDTDKRAAKLEGRVSCAKKRKLETYADVVQKQKEEPPPEPMSDKPRAFTTLMKVKAVRRKIPRRCSLQMMAEEFALSDVCGNAILCYSMARHKRLPYTKYLSEPGLQNMS